MKTTVKLFFQDLYCMMCQTNLTLKIKIHTQDGVDDNLENEPETEDESKDEAIINKIDK